MVCLRTLEQVLHCYMVRPVVTHVGTILEIPRLEMGDETTSINFSVFVVSEEKQSKRLPPILMKSEVEIEPRTKSRISCEPTNNDQFTRYRIASFLISQNHTLPVHLRVKYINQGYPDVFHLIKTGKS